MKIDIPTFLSKLKEEKLEITEEKAIPYGKQLSVTDHRCSVTINLYDKGGILIQGKNNPLKEFLEKLIQKENAPKHNGAGYEDISRIGIDEAGKGDYFGPLVIAAAFLKKGDSAWLREIGIMDSKKIGDAKIMELSKTLKKTIPHEVIVIMPKKYNELHLSIGNLNKLLAWGHARSLENLLLKVECDTAISDQFAKDKGLLERNLKEKGKQIKLIQQHKAEQDTAVAVASILARAEFLFRMKSLGKEYKMNFPKGASNVIPTGVEFIKKYSRELLKCVAKVHFKTTAKVYDRYLAKK